MSNSSGYTLVELLIVLAILAVIGVFAFANLRAFREEKSLQNAASDIQSIIRLAQANAQSGLKCGTSFGASWFVELTDKVSLNMRCQALSQSPVAIKTLNLKDTEIQSIQSSNCASLPVRVIFPPIYGNVSFKNSDQNCGSTLTITLVNIRNQTKNVIINRLGAINVE